MFDLDEFPSCCGINVLTELSVEEGGFFDGKFHNTPSKQIIAEEISRQIIRALGNRGRLLAVTNDEQILIRPYLRKFGFRVVDRFTNPNTGSRLIMWSLKLVGLSEVTVEKRMERICAKK